jgi:hypothetical protein
MESNLPAGVDAMVTGRGSTTAAGFGTILMRAVSFFGAGWTEAE